MDLAQDIVNVVVRWDLLAPELVLTFTACVVLIVDLFLPDDAKWIAMPLSAAGIVGTLAGVVALIGVDATTLAGSFEVDSFALLFKGLFCLIGLLVLAISFHYFRTGRY